MRARPTMSERNGRVDEGGEALLHQVGTLDSP